MSAYMILASSLHSFAAAGSSTKAVPQGTVPALERVCQYRQADQPVQQLTHAQAELHGIRYQRSFPACLKIVGMREVAEKPLRHPVDESPIPFKADDISPVAEPEAASPIAKIELITFLPYLRTTEPLNLERKLLAETHS